MKLIDVSKWQGSIDWSKVKGDGIGGAIIRAGSGSSVDPRFHSYIKGAISAGLHIGIYWFSYAYTVGGGTSEAKKCIETIFQYKNKIDLGVWFDWEYDSIRYARSKGVRASLTLVTAITRAFCVAVIKAGYKAGYYFNRDFKLNYYDANALKEFMTWYARYTSTKQTGVDIWQYTSKGRVNGINGNVDMDILVNEKILASGSETAKGSESGTASGSGTGATASESGTGTIRKVSETKMPTIKRGSEGKAVKIWQIIVGVKCDGSFGEKTEEATKSFQKKKKLVIDGVVGVNSWRAGLESV